MLPDVQISLGEGGLGRTDLNKDGISGFILQGVATSQLALDTSVLLLSPKDAVALGLDAAYDDANSVLVYYHISEFFRLSPSGQLWIRLVANTVSLADMVDKNNPHAQQLLIDANGDINTLSGIMNPATSYTPANSGGLDADVLAAVAKAQQLADSEFALHRPVFIVIEGRGFNGTAAAATDLRALASKNVCVVIAQDLTIASAKPIYATHAAVGTLAGAISAARVSECIGWIQFFNILSAADSRFLSPGLSSNLGLSAYNDADLSALNDKGFIFGRRLVGNSGVYFNNSHTCTLITSDYAYIENTRTINKAVREVYKALQPRINSPLKVGAGGKLAPEVIKGFESLCNRPLDIMKSNEEASDGATWIDPNQNVLQSSKLKVRIRIIPIGKASFIEVEIGFSTTI